MNTQVKQPQTIADFEVGFTCFDNFLKYISKRLQGAQKGRGSENWLGKLWPKKNIERMVLPNKIWIVDNFMKIFLTISNSEEVLITA